ncbi:UDP-N-acetylmuramoyl-tripeptide--D-alanyl-D-alanine ligase [Candidatus Collierbacteria bacterium]|nr:UDP-N-acetylmuramoyl-tripeptide--D-alanyl-D-alanine ligase [Candidatus Collierbacteria bacterium]
MQNPLKSQLHILQLEGYDWKRFARWWLSHPFTFSTSQKKPLVYTFKAKLILTVTIILFILPLFLRPPYLILTTFYLILIFEPFPLLFLSLVIIKPYEFTRRFLTKETCRRSVLEHPHLTVIGITGSYGKTSTKDFLFEILSRENQTLKTPESYNTVFGIAKVVETQLHSKLNYFICEMGAYVRGEIKELTHMVPPNYAILTAIGSQHLERFKSLENTTLAKFELIDTVKPENALVNLDNKFISNQLELPDYQGVKTYSFIDPRADFFVKSHHLTTSGSNLEVVHQSKTYHFETKLFGTSNLENLIAAIGIAFMLGLDSKIIQSSVAQITPSPHRLQLISLGKCILIDNAYSSNKTGFTKIIADLTTLPGKKALITPGIIELGDHTAVIHEKIGRKAAGVFDRIILVGHSERTENLARGIGQKVKIDYLANNSSVWPTIDALAKTYDWILLENDLPDNF